MKVKHIDKFLFGSANYLVSDGQSAQVELRVDYKNNKFAIVGAGEVRNEFREELAAIAKDLLKRKHAVNIAERE